MDRVDHRITTLLAWVDMSTVRVAQETEAAISAETGSHSLEQKVKADETKCNWLERAEECVIVWMRRPTSGRED